jgi:hypothetical protein
MLVQQSIPSVMEEKGIRGERRLAAVKDGDLFQAHRDPADSPSRLLLSLKTDIHEFYPWVSCW